MGIEHRILNGQSLKLGGSNIQVGVIQATHIQVGAIQATHMSPRTGGYKKVTMSGGAKLVTFTGAAIRTLIPAVCAPSLVLTLTGAPIGSQQIIRAQSVTTQGTYASVGNASVSFYFVSL